MTNKVFWKWLIIITAGVTALIFTTQSVILPELTAHQNFTISCIVLFVLISAILYWAAQNAIKSTNKFAFTNIISVSVFGKMVFALAFLFAYQKVAAPADQGFVGIFLVNYVVYTVYEVWFMSKLARGK